MSRTLSAGLTSHLATTGHNRVNMIRLDLVDGSTLAITDHNKDLAFDLGDGSATYSASTGIMASDLALSVGFQADDIELVGPITDTGTTTRTAFLGGRFDDAVVRIFQVNWKDLTQGAIKLLKGYVALAEVSGGKFKLTVHSEASKFSQTTGRVISAYCDADFGDARCGATPIEDTVTVTAVTSAQSFTVTNPNTRAADFFNKGTVTFTAGALLGCRPVEVYDWTLAGVVTLWTSLAEPPSIGDTLTIKQGCGKTRADCLVYENVANFRGFPDVPGSDQVLRYPNPGG